MTTKHSLTAAEIRSRFKIGDSVIVTLYRDTNIEKEKVTMTVTDIDNNDNTCTIQLDNWWYDNSRVKFHDEFDMPEIEPGMWAKDRNGDNWLAVKTSRNSPHISWVKSTICSHDNDELFQSKIMKLQDRDANGLSQIVVWDRNKQTQLKELQQKQQELAKELEALNQQIQALK